MADDSMILIAQYDPLKKNLIDRDLRLSHTFGALQLRSRPPPLLPYLDHRQKPIDDFSASNPPSPGSGNVPAPIHHHHHHRCDRSFCTAADGQGGGADKRWKISWQRHICAPRVDGQHKRESMHASQEKKRKNAWQDTLNPEYVHTSKKRTQRVP